MRLYTNKKQKDFKSMTKLSFTVFIAELPNFVLTAISCFTTHTPVVWVDTINSLGETLHCLIVYLVTKLLQKNNEDEYNFGVERIEVFAAFFCDVLVIVGMLAVLFGAIYGLINPTSPANSLGLFLILKMQSIIWDAAFLFSALKASKKADSRLGDSEVRNYIKVLTFDAVIAVVVAVTYFFRTQKWVCYANPMASILIIFVFLIIYIGKLKESIGELVDKSIALEKQDEVFDIILENKEVIKQIEEVNCRKLNGKTYIEICVKMHDEITYQQQVTYLEKIRKEINVIIPDAIVKLIIGQMVN